MDEIKKNGVKFELSIAEFQLKFAQVVRAVGEGREYTITRHGHPAARAVKRDLKLSEIDMWISTRKARAALGSLVSGAGEGRRIMVTSSGEPAFVIEPLTS